MEARLLSIALLIIVLSEWVISSPVTTDSNSFVVSTTEPSKEKNANESNESLQINPQIYSMQIQANVSNRFARTLITSKVRNGKKSAEETTFSVILPENAFISEFEMEIGGKVYKAYVKEKKEAKEIYQQAVSSGQSAAHVELNARDSKTFTVSVNIEPESKTIFRLIYEELLQRENGQYELIMNINPGQIVEDLGVQVYINESRPLTFVRTPSLRSGNEISKNNDKLDPSAEIHTINSSSAVVKFSPDITQQKTFAEELNSKKENGLAGQFVVQYDVERDPQGGEVLVRDGYFVHFFAPSELKPLPKHVVFVLDHSVSMGGRKIDQLIEAMQNILSELKPEDSFNIVRFSDEASVWNATENKFVTIHLGSSNYGHLEPHLKEASLPEAVTVTKENTEKAKNIIKDKYGMSLTNIIGGLEIGLFLTRRTEENAPGKYQPMLIFLTDGLPNVGISSGDEITNIITKLNSGEKRTAIFSLSFGESADKTFLKKLSSKNLGFSRHIYEAADASLQLQDFYSKISSPLLSNITFKYVDGISDVTNTHYPILFNGSELVVAGRISDNQNTLLRVNGRCITGPITFNATRTEPVTSVERLWAYLTVKQLLKNRETETNATDLTKKALDLSLKYSFVTEISSLVVVKPNRTDSVDSKAAIPRQGRQHFQRPAFSSASYPVRTMGAPIQSYHLLSSSRRVHATPYSARLAGFYPRTGGGSPFRMHTSRPFYPSSHKPTTSSPVQNSTIPQWLDTLVKNNENITTTQGTFKIGQRGVVTTRLGCLKTPSNDTGVCTIIFDCPQVFSLLTDLNVYLQYFCPLNEFAGVCCPQNTTTAVNL